MMFSVTGTVLIGALCLVFLKVKQALSSGLRGIPGPWYSTWTNLVLKAHVLGGNRSQYIHSLHGKYGHTVRISPTEVSISDLDAFQTIHRPNSGFVKSGWYFQLSDGSRPGLFTMTDPKVHSQRRRLFSQEFSNSSILKLEPVVRDSVDLAIAKIKRDAQAGSADILKWFTYMATDVMGQLSFGESFHMLETEKKTQYIEDLEATMMLSGLRTELSLILSILGLLPIPQIRHILSLRSRLDEYGRQAIQKLAQFIGADHPSSQTALFARFVNPEKNSDLSEQDIIEEASNLIVAGSDTTGISLTYLVWAVLKPEHQHIRKALEEEIQTLPDNAGASEVASLRYLRAVIDEALRLYGAAPGSLPRIVPSGGVTLGGYYIPQGMTVSTQAFTIHRDPEIFEDPSNFRPERWINPTPKMKSASSPFGAGARTCIGVHLANLELTLAVFRFFKECPNFHLAVNTTAETMKMENYFLIAPAGHKCEVTAASISSKF